MSGIHEIFNLIYINFEINYSHVTIFEEEDDYYQYNNNFYGVQEFDLMKAYVFYYTSFNF